MDINFTIQTEKKTGSKNEKKYKALFDNGRDSSIRFQGDREKRQIISNGK